VDTKSFFRKLVAFTTSVHQATNDITKGLKSDAITPVQYGILQYVAVSQPVTLSEISDCQRLSMPNASREIKKLREKNLCEKVAAGGDRRKQYVRLTKEGQALMDETFGRIEGLFLERIKGASEQELSEIERALDLLQAKVFYTNR